MAVRPVRLLAIGDVAWDILVRPERELVWGSDVFGAVELMPGGAAANVAVWAQRLGARATLVGKVGADTLGELMLRHLRDEGVTTRIAEVADLPTLRIGIVIDPQGEHGFVIDHTRPLTFSADDLPTSLLDHADAVFFNGYAIFTSQSTEFLHPLLTAARRRQIPVAFDPSSFALIRAFGAARLLDELGPLDVLLANSDEVKALCGDAPPSSLHTWTKLLVMKQGADGAAAYRAGESWCDSAVPVPVVDTTGAGDAFDAAFLVEWLGGGSVERALAEGNRLGAHVARHMGAQAAATDATTSGPTPRA